MNLFKIIFGSVIFFLICNEISFSQVAMNPMILFVDYESKIGTFEIVNPSEEIREFNMQFKFGYNKFDSLGRSQIEYDDKISEEKYSLLPYLKIFPKKLVIPPKQTQTVRVMISNLPDNLDRTLWTRITISSEPVVKQIDTAKLADDKVGARIKIVTNVNGIIAMNCGNATSAIDFDLFKTTQDSNYFNLIFDIQKSGTSPFFGNMKLKIVDEVDNELIDKVFNIVAYENTKFAINIEKSSLKKGKLEVISVVSNERETTPKRLRLPFKTLTKKFTIVY